MTKTIRRIIEADDTPKIPVLLLKFGKLEYLRKLLIDGELYVSSVEELRKYKDGERDGDDFRIDAAEGAQDYVSTGLANMTFDTLKCPDGKPLSLPIQNMNYFKGDKVRFGNISSFYGITTECFKNNILIPIDSRMKKFGNHFIVIKDFEEFVKRIDSVLEKTTQTSWSYSFVKYFDEDTYNGPLNLYKKRSRFSFQKEFRIAFKTQDTIPIKIDIGNIEDIAFILSSNVLEHVQMTLDLSKNICNMRWPIFEVDTN